MFNTLSIACTIGTLFTSNNTLSSGTYTTGASGGGVAGIEEASGGGGSKGGGGTVVREADEVSCIASATEIPTIATTVKTPPSMYIIPRVVLYQASGLAVLANLLVYSAPERDAFIGIDDATGKL